MPNLCTIPIPDTVHSRSVPARACAFQVSTLATCPSQSSPHPPCLREQVRMPVSRVGAIPSEYEETSGYLGCKEKATQIPGQVAERSRHPERRGSHDVNVQSLSSSDREVERRKRVSTLDLDSYTTLLKLSPRVSHCPSLACPSCIWPSSRNQKSSHIHALMGVLVPLEIREPTTARALGALFLAISSYMTWLTHLAFHHLGNGHTNIPIP